MTSSLAPLIDLEACGSYKKRFKVATGISIYPVALYTMLYGQDVPIVNFLVGKSQDTALAARFRVTLVEGGEKDYGTN